MDISLKPLDRQAVVITGASSGIGLATALMAAKAGAKVSLVARSGPILDGAVKQIRREGGEAIAVVADVAVFEEVERAAQLALQNFGRIDTWVNNAGVSVYGRIDEVELRDARRIFDVNYWGVVHGSLAALPHLRQQGGALINLGSEASDAAIPLQGAYTASKHAVKGFTDSLRIELEADDAPVSVTLVQPTAVDTPYPEHAGNYLSQEPKLPTPMIDPQSVARAILAAAVRPTRHVRVGAMAVINTAMAKTLPRIADAVAVAQIGRRQRDEAPHHGSGNLYTPSNDGRTCGRGNEVAADFSAAKAANVRPADAERASSA
jgi:short-subunit dehydrogenase